MLKRYAFAPLLLAASCTDVGLDPAAAWQARLVATTAEPVTGSVAAASLVGRTSSQAGIELEAAPNTTYGWRINRGVCGGSGAVVGGRANYPQVKTDAMGKGIVEQTAVNERLESEGVFHAVVLSPGTDAVLACGRLERQEF